MSATRELLFVEGKTSLYLGSYKLIDATVIQPHEQNETKTNACTCTDGVVFHLI